MWIVEINIIFVDNLVFEGICLRFDMRKSALFWIACSGLLWFAVGVFLLLFGVKLVVFSCLQGSPQGYLLAKLSSVTKNKEQSALLLVTLGLFLGFFKGRMVLSKTVKRVTQRIYSLPEPIQLSQVYSLKYVGLIACMILLGMGLRWFSVPSDVRGTIDIAIGSALMNGAICYFRTIRRKEKPTAK